MRFTKAWIRLMLGTKMHHWLSAQMSAHGIEPSAYPMVHAITKAGGLSEALISGRVDHILSDVSVLNEVLKQVSAPDRYQVSLEMKNKTPQAFVFGSTLKPELRKAINIALASMNYSGDANRLEQTWQK